MLAIIRTGGKQYIVTPGQKIKIEKINAPAFANSASVATSAKEAASAFGRRSRLRPTKSAGKQEIIFDEVLLLEKQRKIEIGTPLVKGAKVIGKILSHGKGKKVIVFKYKSKNRYRIKKGHRQPFTEVEILRIETS